MTDIERCRLAIERLQARISRLEGSPNQEDSPEVSPVSPVSPDFRVNELTAAGWVSTPAADLDQGLDLLSRSTARLAILEDQAGRYIAAKGGEEDAQGT